MSTRMHFLPNTQHRIRFVYTPKRASWLNQIELWLSILVRRLLRRASFVSVKHQVLQQNHGQAIQVDLPGPTVDHLNQKRICADED